MANLFTAGTSVCLHDGLKNGMTAQGLVGAMGQCLQANPEAEYLGDADSGLLLYWRQMQVYYPAARWVLIHRDPAEAQASYRTYFAKLESEHKIILVNLYSENIRIRRIAVVWSVGFAGDYGIFINKIFIFFH